MPGAAIAIRIEGQPLLAIGVGHQDLHQTIPIPTDASFYIYSVTKSLIAAAVMNQAKAGRLNLDVPIQNYWPNFPVQTPITLRQILGHTSGLSDYGSLPTYSNAVKTTPDLPWSPAAFLEVAARRGFAPPPSPPPPIGKATTWV